MERGPDAVRDADVARRCAYYCAVGATSGVAPTTGVVAAVGDDFDIGAVERLGVDTAGLTRVPGGTTARFVITQLGGRDAHVRGVLGRRGVGRRRGLPGGVPAGASRPPGHGPAEQQPGLARAHRGGPGAPRSRPTSSSPSSASSRKRRRVVRVADVVFMNEEEAALLRATEQPWPPGDVVLKRGAAGAAYYHGSPAPASPISPICAPAPPTRAVETTGAGDLLAGAFLALRMGVSPGRALDAAVRVASASVTDFGVDHPQLQHTIAGVRDTLLAGSRRDHLHLRQKPRTRPPTL